MAVDSWVPHRFGNLSERLVTRNGILLVGLAAGALMVYTRGRVSLLVVLYSINVFLTFSLSQLAMVRFWTGGEGRGRRRRAWNLTVHGTALVLCVGILAVTVVEKFAEGGWLTLLITSSLVGLCVLIQRHYAGIRSQIREMDTILGGLGDLRPAGPADPPDPSQPVAVLLVSGYSGLGIHALLSIQRLFPSYYRNVIFLSVGVVNSGRFKGPAEMEALNRETEANLQRYVDVARGLGLRATFRYAFGTDVVEEADRMGAELAREYPRSVFFLGKLIFAQERWTHRILHNDTAFAIQRRLQFQGIQTVILPIRMTAG